MGCMYGMLSCTTTSLCTTRSDRLLLGHMDQRLGESYLSLELLTVLKSLDPCRQEMQGLYVYLDGLVRFIDLNCEGFRKALKKHDKVLASLGQSLLKDNYMPIVALKCCQRSRPLVEVSYIRAWKLNCSSNVDTFGLPLLVATYEHVRFGLLRHAVHWVQSVAQPLPMQRHVAQAVAQG